MDVDSFPLIKWDLPKNEGSLLQQTQEICLDAYCKNDTGSKYVDKRSLEEPESGLLPKRTKYSEDIITTYSDTIFHSQSQNLINYQTSYSDSFIGKSVKTCKRTNINSYQKILTGFQTKDNTRLNVEKFITSETNDVQFSSESVETDKDELEKCNTHNTNDKDFLNELTSQIQQQKNDTVKLLQHNKPSVENEFSFLQYKIYDKNGDFVNSSYNEKRNLHGNECHKVICKEEKLLKQFSNSDQLAGTSFSSVMAVTVKLSMECEELTENLTKEMSPSDSSLPLHHSMDSPLPFRTNNTDINLQTTNFDCNENGQENEVIISEHATDKSIIEMIKNIKTMRVKSEQEYITSEIKEKCPLTIKDFIW